MEKSESATGDSGGQCVDLDAWELLVKISWYMLREATPSNNAQWRPCSSTSRINDTLINDGNDTRGSPFSEYVQKTCSNHKGTKNFPVEATWNNHNNSALQKFCFLQSEPPLMLYLNDIGIYECHYVRE